VHKFLVQAILRLCFCFVLVLQLLKKTSICLVDQLLLVFGNVTFLFSVSNKVINSFGLTLSKCFMVLVRFKELNSSTTTINCCNE